MMFQLLVQFRKVKMNGTKVDVYLHAKVAPKCASVIYSLFQARDYLHYRDVRSCLCSIESILASIRVVHPFKYLKNKNKERRLKGPLSIGRVI